MLRCEILDVQGFNPAIHGMRNPKNSWDNNHSDCIFYLWIISSCKGHIISKKDGGCYCSVFWCNVYNRI